MQTDDGTDPLAFGYVPTLDHLSPNGSIRASLGTTVEQLGARVLVARDETGMVRGSGMDR